MQPTRLFIFDVELLLRCCLLSHTRENIKQPLKQHKNAIHTGNIDYANKFNLFTQGMRIMQDCSLKSSVVVCVMVLMHKTTFSTGVNALKSLEKAKQILNFQAVTATENRTLECESS